MEMKNLPYHAELKATGGGNGKLVLSDGGNGDPALYDDCSPLATCTYGAGQVEVDVEGGEPATLSIAAPLDLVEAESSKFCPTATQTLSAEFEVTEPEGPLYVAIE